MKDGQVPHGIGRIYMSLKIYEGQFVLGEWGHGYGRLIEWGGTVKTGLFTNVILNGRGKIIRDGYSESGYFKDGKLHG